MRFCQIICTASAVSKVAPKPSDGSRPAVDCGMLPYCHTAAPRLTAVPDTPSNSSRYACPVRFGSGRVRANSPLMSRNASDDPLRLVMELTSRLSAVGLKCRSVLTPATRLALASKPSAGRANAELSRW